MPSLPPSPPLSLRTVDPDDEPAFTAFLSQMRMVFTDPQPTTPERVAHYRPRVRDHRLTGAYDGDQVVGTYRSWDTRVTLPGGGTLPVDAVSSVTVRPTHRRRGVLTALMRADLADAAARGLPAAVLLASEAGIYGRFGFGAASDTATWEIDLRSARIAPHVPSTGRTEVTDPQRVRALLPAVFEAARRPGAMDRDEQWWDARCDVVRPPGDTPRARYCILHRDDDGVPRGYAFYSWTDDWRERRSHTVAHVDDLQAATPKALAALWTFFASLDLVATVRAEDRPVDEPLPWLFTDARAARRTSTADFLWVRLLDPAAVLGARGYESPGRAEFSVTDRLGHATGHYSLEVAADGTGKAVRLAGDVAPAAELEVPVDVLSSLVLGAGDLHAAAVAGRVVEREPGAVDRLARLLRTSRAPWTGTWF